MQTEAREEAATDDELLRIECKGRRLPLYLDLINLTSFNLSKAAYFAHQRHNEL